MRFRPFIFSLLSLLFAARGQSQVLISLILGDKLNSPRVEFGLDGGLSLSQLRGLNPSETMRTFNLGFYFDIKFKQNPAWMINTGEMVISYMGAEGITPYSLNDAYLDSAFKGGDVRRKLSYFNTPIFIKHKFKNNLYIKLGMQICLMNKAYDIFKKSVEEKDDLGYRYKIRSQYNAIDLGPSAGIGYRLMGGNGMNIGVQYYYGMLAIMKDSKAPKIYNHCLYLNIGIPIGAAKAAKKREEKSPDDGQ